MGHSTSCQVSCERLFYNFSTFESDITRGHIYRCHRIPTHCDRCFQVFKDEEALKSHNRAEEQGKEMCRINNDPPQLKGFDRKQETLLRSRKGLKGKDDAARWIQVYMILFPEVGLDLPNPCRSLCCIREKDSLT
jgi:hypothetical protein